MFRLIVIQTEGSPIKTDWSRHLLRRWWICIYTFPFSLSKWDSKSAFQWTVPLRNNSQQETDLFFVYLRASWDLFSWSLSKKSRPGYRWTICLKPPLCYSISTHDTGRASSFQISFLLHKKKKNHTKEVVKEVMSLESCLKMVDILCRM